MGKIWYLIRDNIHSTVNRESERKYRLLENKLTRLKETEVENRDNIYKSVPREINQTDINFTNGEFTLLNKGLKYNFGYKYKSWIREEICAITLLPPEKQDYTKYQVAKHLKRIQTQQTSKSR